MNFSNLCPRLRLFSPGMVLLMAGALAIFCLQAQYRSHLIPRQADYTQRRFLLTGDEPSYLLMAQAIAGGYGLNVRPILESGAYQRFYTRPLLAPDRNTWKYYFGSGWIVPAIDRSADWQDAQKMPFTPLLPLLMAPYVNRVDNPRWLTGLLQSGLTCVLFLFLMRRFAFSETKRLWIPMLGMIALLGGIPIGYYTTLLFPEILGGSALLAAGMLVLAGGARSWLLVFSLHLLALLATPRAAPVVMAMQGFMMFDAFRTIRWRKALLALVGCGLVWGGYLSVNLSIWGTTFPPMGSSFLKNFFFVGVADQVSMLGFMVQKALSLATGILRVLYGRDVGLFFFCPISLWSIWLAAKGWKDGESRSASVLWALLFAGSVFSLALYPDYRAGTCPSGRYQVIPAFLCAMPILAAGGWNRSKFQWHHLATFLWLFAITIGLALLVAGHPHLWFRRYHPLFGYPSIQGYYNWLPSFESPLAAADVCKAAGWTALFFFPALLATVLRLARRWTHRAKPSLAAPG